MRVIIQKLYNQSSQETGAILSVITPNPVTILFKNQIENMLIQYAINTLYPQIGINTFSDTHNDTIAITVIKNINELPDVDISNAFQF